MEAFNRLYEEVLQGHPSEFQSMIDYIYQANGKQIRPLILLLSAKICGKINDKTFNFAVVLELLHTATLIHDDVIDDTKVRRGKASVNACYDNRIAVLLGDYILSLSIIRTILARNFQVMEIISNVAKNLAEGELTQWTASNGTILKEERYFEIIRKKTAVLLSSCAELGALSVDADKETIEQFRLFGEHIGLCFQIKDDIFDYFEQGEIGKPTGNDLREGKITLPLIYALNHAPKHESEQMTEILKSRNLTMKNIRKLILFAKQQKGIEYAESKMEESRQKALAILSQFPDSEAKSGLIQLVDYIINRNK